MKGVIFLCKRLFLQDAMSVARNILKHPKLVPGGGATELTVSATLKQKSSSIEGIEKVKCVFSNIINFCILRLKSLKIQGKLEIK